MAQTSDFIIIGGGVIGCSAAYQLAKQGQRSITVLEAHEIGWGGSSRNGGGVRQSARDPRELPLAIHAVQHLWPTLSEELGTDVEYCQGGNLRLGITDRHQKKLNQLVQECVAGGLDVRMLDKQEILEICPYVGDAVTCASWCPTDGHANPLRTTLAFYRKARELGVRFVMDEPVLELRKVRGQLRQVITTKEVYEAERIILAAGFESRALANTVGIDIPMGREFSEVCISEAYDPLFSQMIGTADGDFYGHQTSHGSFAFGATSGLEMYDSDYHMPITHSITAPGLTRAIVRYFPVLKNLKIIRTWSGWRDMCADHIAVISKVPEVPGLILGCAFTGHGFGIAPTAGLLLSELAQDKSTTLPVEAFRYDRFTAKI